jgi:hypothetical protein
MSLRAQVLAGAALGFGISSFAFVLAFATIRGDFLLYPGAAVLTIIEKLRGDIPTWGAPGLPDVTWWRVLVVVGFSSAFYTGAGAFIAWVSARRHVARVPGPTCRKCRYSLMGNVSGVCPECGTPTSHKQDEDDSQRPG